MFYCDCNVSGGPHCGHTYKDIQCLPCMKYEAGIRRPNYPVPMIYVDFESEIAKYQDANYWIGEGIWRAQLKVWYRSHTVNGSFMDDPGNFYRETNDVR